MSVLKNGLDPADLVATINPRATSLIMTVFGDTIAPCGGNTWLSGLIEVLKPFGLSERLVRTAIYRLTREGWLVARTRGRRSCYELTATGIEKFAEAEKRIYATTTPAWDGMWTIVHPIADMPGAARQKLRQDLKWSGFGELSSGILIRPKSSGQDHPSALANAASENKKIMVVEALLSEELNSMPPADIARSSWKLETLNNAYWAFRSLFSAYQKIPPKDPQSAFILKTLLVHEYRRILLQDPQLPIELLPDDWNGTHARELLAKLYPALSGPANQYVKEKMQSWKGTPLVLNAKSKRFVV